MAWRTATSGHAARATGFVTGRLHEGRPLFQPLDLEDTPPNRCDHKRYCQECGKEVCSYKDAHMEKVWCYAHDHLTPWTRPYIVGKEHATARGIIGEVEGAA